MENARDDIAAPDDPVFADAEGVPEAAALADAANLKDTSPAPATPNATAPAPGTGWQREELHASFNDRISYLCKLAALVIAVVALATMVLGQELPQFVLMGLCLSVALLAIAMLQDHSQRKR